MAVLLRCLMNDNPQPIEEQPEDKIIFQAILTPDKKIKIEIKSGNLMGLSYAYKLLGLHIDNVIIKETMPAPKVVKIGQGGLQDLRRFLKL